MRHSPSKTANDAPWIAALTILGFLLASCIANPPAIRSAETELSGDLQGTKSDSGHLLAIDSSLPTPTPYVKVSEVDGMEMVYVHAGGFTMGIPYVQYAGADDASIHKVYLDAFWIDKTEVTNRMYARCVEAGSCRPPAEGRSLTRDRYYDDPAYADHPVIYVSWNQAVEYCQWAGRRLPTEAEWEKAARGTERRVYPWGDDDPEGIRMNVCDDCAERTINDGHADTARVGSYPMGASPYGALDMAGNVWEWVADWYDEDYYARSPSENPLGPPSGHHRVRRGGSISWEVEYGRTGERERMLPTQAENDTGFRCATEALRVSDHVAPRNAR